MQIAIELPNDFVTFQDAAIQGRSEMFNPDDVNTRSQDLEDAWHDAGQFYWGRADAWLQGRMIFGPTSAPIKLSRHRVQDIDTPEDWERAAWLFKALTDKVSQKV